jgi:sugar lactone lactonase YvrE
MKNLMLALLTILCTEIAVSQSTDLQGIYQCTGYFFHPSASRSLDLSKTITQISANRYQVGIGDLEGSGYIFQFDVDANNNVVNWVAIGSTSAAPASGFMTSDNPGAFSFYPGSTVGFIQSIYNNKYNPLTKTFYLHYGYQTGATSQNQYQRQVYEKYVLTAGQPKIISYSTSSGTYGTQIVYTGKNFTGGLASFGGGIKIDSFSIVSDSIMRVWPGGGTSTSGRLFLENSFSLDSTSLFDYTAPSTVNTTWQYVGLPGFSGISQFRGINMAMTKTNIPYVAFRDSLGRAKVMKYTASTNTWTTVGTSVSDGACAYVNIKLDNNNIPYVAFQDSLNGNAITVKKLSGTSWLKVGTAGFARLDFLSNYSSIQLAIDGNNYPYVLSTDTTGGIYALLLFKFNGSSWSILGTDINSGFTPLEFSIDVSKTTNTPYVLFSDEFAEPLVRKFIGGFWQDVGSSPLALAPNGIYYPTLKIDKLDNPNVVMQYDDNHERLSLYKLGTIDWSNSNSDRFSKGHSYGPSLAFDKNNRPVVAFTDASFNGKITVMTQNQTGQWVYVGERGVFASNYNPDANSLSIDSTNTPFIAFIDQNNGNRLSVMKYKSTLSTTIKSYTPTAAIAGTNITIKGTGFTGARAVKFNTTAATSFTVLNDSTITSVLGTGATGAINITTADGGIASKDGFVFCSTPTISTAITGSIDVCPSIGGDTSSSPVIYYIKKISTAVNYLWTMPAGATILSGQGDTAVLVSFSRSFVSGTISVIAVNACGQSSTAKTLIVYKRVAATPTAIQRDFTPSTAAVTNVCGLTSEVYKIRKVTYAISYDWKMKLGTAATIVHLNALGENDTAIRVYFSSSLIKDTVSVAAISSCSIGTPTYAYVSGNGTIAGGNGSGSGANQLSGPRFTFIDKTGNIYIADHLNHRIVKWAPGATNGVIVAGGNGAGSASNQLNYPSGVFVDKNGNIFVSDNNNHRVQKWIPGSTSGVTVAGGNGLGSGTNQLNYPGGVVVDSLGRIYVSDNSNHRVMRWQSGISYGTVVAGGNGAGSAANQLFYPHGIFLDSAFNLYITDDNNRVQKWAPAATSGVTVAGGNGVGLATNQLNYPYGVAVDKFGVIYVADASNHRVQKFVPGSNTGKTIAGGNGNGAAINQLSYPTGVAIDSSGAVYISDNGNHRIQKLVTYLPTSIVTTSKTIALSTQLIPPPVTSINGSLTPCIGNSIVYSANASSPTSTQSVISTYRWTKPNFTTITSATTDSSSITVLFNTGFTGGTITSKGQSACGIAGTAKSITLLYLPPTPTSITSSTGLYNACIGNLITYSAVVPAPSTTQVAATKYRWTIPNYTTITSASTDSLSITLRFNTGYTGGSVTVKGQTVCGAQGTAKSQALTHTGCPTGTNNLPVTKSANPSLDLKDFNVTVFPNPTSSLFTVSVDGAKSVSSIRVLDLQGRALQQMKINPNEKITLGSKLNPGAYMLEVKEGEKVKTMRVVKY